MDVLQDISTVDVSETISIWVPVEKKTPVAEFIRRWGGSASIALLDPSFEIFSTPGVEGIIGYRLESRCAVVFGDPLCNPVNEPILVRAFHKFCKEKGWRVAYVTASERFAKWSIKHTCGSLIETGEELTLDPHRNPRSGAKGRALRNKVNNSIRAGIEVLEYTGFNNELQKNIEQVGVIWLSERKGPQIYLAEVDLFAERTGKRWFYAKHGENIVGVLQLNKLEARQGWSLHLVMTVPSAPMGTSEQLVLSAINALKEEGCHFLTFGISQAENLGEMQGIGICSEWIARSVFKLAKRVFHLDTRRRFWRKFQPQKENSYLLFSEPGIRLSNLLSVMRSLNVI